ncbi:hypothetical protein [Nocardioides sp. B-3]|uniref:hypothetical protein n=1 Tax=Nocardioides sp. B-3 TaxID=2895565 RepID=UPI0021521D0C|nr:hypothetical protein [Nocardioides sp. B-3]UUZ59125.1 hypothetical protein LP418_24815 [Nocardioides sp. B-3]
MPSTVHTPLYSPILVVQLFPRQGAEATRRVDIRVERRIVDSEVLDERGAAIVAGGGVQVEKEVGGAVVCVRPCVHQQPAVVVPVTVIRPSWSICADGITAKLPAVP